MIPANVRASNKNSKFDTEVAEKADQAIWKFLTRGEKMRRTSFPESTRTKLIIKGKSDGFGYVESIDSNFRGSLPIPQSDVLDFIKQCNKLINNLYCEKRKLDDYDFLASNLPMLWLVFIVALAGIIMLGIGDQDRESTVLFWIGISILVFAGVLVIILATWMMLKEKKHLNIYRELDTRMRDLISQKNVLLVGRRAAEFILEPEHRWIEFTFAEE